MYRYVMLTYHGHCALLYWRILCLLPPQILVLPHVSPGCRNREVHQWQVQDPYVAATTDTSSVNRWIQTPNMIISYYG